MSATVWLPADNRGIEKSRLPSIHRPTHLKLGATQQLCVQNAVIRPGKRVVGTQPQGLECLTGNEAFDPLGDCAPDIGIRRKRFVISDEIFYVIAEICDAEFHGIRQTLLKTNVVPEARFRFQIWIAEKTEIREVLEHLRESRRLEPAADADFELRIGLRDEIDRGHAKRGFAPKAVVR